MTSRYHGTGKFWITIIGSLSNDDGDGRENSKKAIGLDSKITTLHVYDGFFFYIS